MPNSTGFAKDRERLLTCGAKFEEPRTGIYDCRRRNLLVIRTILRDLRMIGGQNALFVLDGDRWRATIPPLLSQWVISCCRPVLAVLAVEHARVASESQTV
jgi:hypothetical protein